MMSVAHAVATPVDGVHGVSAAVGNATGLILIPATEHISMIPHTETRRDASSRLQPPLMPELAYCCPRGPCSFTRCTAIAVVARFPDDEDEEALQAYR